MGQRHQLYYRVWAAANKKPVRKWHCFHSQWCYGSLPLWRLKWILEFDANASEFNKLSRTENRYGEDIQDTRLLLSQLISTNSANGFHEHVSDISQEVMVRGKPDLHLGDNNDGVTIVDLTGEQPAYAFVLLEDETGYAPLTGAQYAEGYYKPGSKQWGNFDIDSLDSYIRDQARLLTIDELIKMFPNTYKKVLSERAVIAADPKNIPLLIATGDIVYKAANLPYATQILKGGAHDVSKECPQVDHADSLAAA